MTAQRNQEAWDALRRDRDELAARVTAFALERSIRQMTEKRNLELLGQVAGLAAQVEVMREALRAIARDNRPYTMAQNAIEVLALPNTAADILRQRDALVLREAAADLVAGKLVGWPFISDALLKMADELERKPLRDMTEADFNEAHGG